MADLAFQGNVYNYINQRLCSYSKMFWSCSKKLHNMGRIYSWYVSGGTIKIKIPEYCNCVSVTHAYICQLHSVYYVKFLKLLFRISLRQFLLKYFWNNFFGVTFEFLIGPFFSLHLDKLGIQFANKNDLRHSFL